MDYHHFLEQLPEHYLDWGRDSVQPKSGEFATILQQVQGMTTASVMQLLNLAVDCLEEEEVYCEVGTYLGSTLIGALYHHPETIAYAVDNFAEYNPTGDNFEKLLENISQFGLGDQVYFYDQDFEQFFLELKILETPPKIGVYFYDGAHDYRSVFLGLLLVKPFLSANALIIVDDYNWATVQQAVWDFIAIQPECQSVLEVLTPVARYPSFWNGLQVMTWQKTVQVSHYSLEDLSHKRQPQVICRIYDLQMQEQDEESIKSLYLEAVYWHQQKHFARAKENYQKYLIWYGADERAWLGLGILYCETECYPDALKTLYKAIELKPEHGLSYYYLGFVFEKTGDLNRSIQAYQTASDLSHEKRVAAYNNLGRLLLSQGQYDRAKSCYEAAIELDPKEVVSYLNLGNVLLEQGKFDAAVAIYQEALQFDNQNPDLAHNLNLAFTIQQNAASFYLKNARSFYAQRTYIRAKVQYQNALEAGIQTEEVYLRLVDCLSRLGQGGVLELLRAGVKENPQSQELQFRLVTTLLQTGQTDALEAVQFAQESLPNCYIFKLFGQLFLPLIYQSLEELEFYQKRFNHGLETLRQTFDISTSEALENVLEGIARFTPFYLTYQARNIVQEQRQYGALVHRAMAGKYPQWCRSLSMPQRGESEDDRKIRVGYLSEYFHAHSGTLWLTGWLKHCDRSRFEQYCYYIGNSPDPVTQTFQNYSDTFHQMPFNLEAIYQQVLADRLHILVFPEIGMNAQVIQLAALRLAPIQCTAWGHPVTSGLPTIDYFLSSELMEPENGQNHYTETLIRLPHIGVAYPKPQVPEPTRSRQYFGLEDRTSLEDKAGLEDNTIAYLCCQAPFKYLPQHDFIFPAIAQQVPQAKFIFIRAEVLQPRLQRAFAAKGLEMQHHCLFLPVQPRQDYLTLNLYADIYLDTLGFTGGNTTLDAIACGLPVVTCPGSLMRGRLSYAMLTRIGVTETIAQNEENYIEIAVALGQDRQWRQAVREKIQNNCDRLFDDRTCVQALETFYEQIVLERF